MTLTGAALQALPQGFRMAVYYADIEGFRYKEIAEIMDTPIGTVCRGCTGDSLQRLLIVSGASICRLTA